MSIFNDAIGTPISINDEIVLMLWDYGQHKMETSLKKGKVIGFTKQRIIVECESGGFNIKVRKKPEQITVVGRGIAVSQEEIAELRSKAFDIWMKDKTKISGKDFDILDHAILVFEHIETFRKRYGVNNET